MLGAMGLATTVQSCTTPGQCVRLYDVVKVLCSDGWRRGWEVV